MYYSRSKEFLEAGKRRMMAQLADGVGQSNEGGQSYSVPGYVATKFNISKAYAKASEHLRRYTQEQES